MADVQDGVRSDLLPLLVGMDTLTPYPGNPRHGHIAALKQGLTRYGQYKPLVVQRSTGHILVGNHTFQAAREMGWDMIAAAVVDVDDATAKKIVAFDNRANELGSYDGEALADLLTSLDGLEGTGFSQDDVDGLLKDLQAADDKAAGAANVDGPPLPPLAGDAETSSVEIRYRIAIECDDAATEDALLDDFLERGYAVTRIFAQASGPKDAQVKVKLAPDTAAPAEQVPEGERAPFQIHPALQAMAVRLEELETYPGNPRRGDVEAIKNSLLRFGQYRPIVARKSGRSGQILAGNHTFLAAQELGWSHVAVTWVVVSDDEAVRIVAWDNRSSELGSTDETERLELLRDIPELAGTGYDKAWFDQVLAKLADADPPVFGVVVDCVDEADQIALLEEFEDAEGIRTRALLS